MAIAQLRTSTQREKCAMQENSLLINKTNVEIINVRSFLLLTSIIINYKDV